MLNRTVLPMKCGLSTRLLIAALMLTIVVRVLLLADINAADLCLYGQKLLQPIVPEAWGVGVSGGTLLQSGKFCVPEAVERFQPGSRIRGQDARIAIGSSTVIANNTIFAIGKRLHAVAQMRLLMAGLIRDICTSMHQLFSTLRETGSYFKQSHIIVLESKSADCSKKRLNTFCKSYDVTCVRSVPENAQSGSRIYRLTSLRQTLLEQIRRFALNASVKWERLLYFDGDIFSGGFEYGYSAAALLLAPIDDMAVDLICANSIRNYPKPGRYRDVFALRENDWHEKVMAGPYFTDENAIWFKGDTLVPVLSCFSGLALYSLPTLVASNCNYTYVSESLCEHVTLHRCLAEHGRFRAAIQPTWAVAFNRHVWNCRNRRSRLEFGEALADSIQTAASFEVSR
jgi:hypothetical protein